MNQKNKYHKYHIVINKTQVDFSDPVWIAEIYLFLFERKKLLDNSYEVLQTEKLIGLVESERLRVESPFIANLEMIDLACKGLVPLYERRIFYNWMNEVEINKIKISCSSPFKTSFEDKKVELWITP